MASETLSTSLEGHDIITVYLSVASEKLDHSLESHDIVKVWVCLSWLTRHWKLVPRQSYCKAMTVHGEQEPGISP